MMSKNKFLWGAATGTALTVLANMGIGNINKSAKSDAEWEAQIVQAETITQARDAGFQEAVCRAEAEGVLVLPPAPLEVLASREPFYRAAAECDDTYKDEVARRRYSVYIQKGY